MKAFIVLGLAAISQAATIPWSNEHQRHARELLGTSFGLPTSQAFDYVVVGGGTGGLAIAARLAEDGTRTVAVVEAGSFYEIGNGNLSQIPVYGPAFSGKLASEATPLVDWGFMTQPQAGFLNASTHYARGKCLGGSSGRNYLTYQRGSKQAYQQWADQVGDSSYEWDSFLPYFEKSLDFTPPNMKLRAANSTPAYDTSTLGNGSGPISVTFGNYAQAFGSWAKLAFNEVGIKAVKGLTSGSILGWSNQLLTIDASTMVRESSETGFMRKIGLKNTNFVVFPQTMGKKVLFDSNKVATGVEVDMAGVVFTLYANKEVIVSAGAFQSPQLLMVSGVGPAATLAKHGIAVVADRPGVGQNMQDHILGGPSFRVNVLTTSALNNVAYDTQATALYNSKQAGMLASNGADLLAFEKIPASLRKNFSSTTVTALNKLPADWPEVEYFSTAAFYGYQESYIFGAPTDAYQYASIAVALAAPMSRGTVDIASNDTADLPLINPNWLTHPADQDLVVAGYKRARAMFNTTAIKPILNGAEYFPGAALGVVTDDQILEFARASFSTVFHASCTCAMGMANDTMAVVDSQARVYGVSKLRVVDISAFPLLPPGHPVATIYALAEKIASDIINA